MRNADVLKVILLLLDKFLLTCPLCHEHGLSYKKFLLHYDCCIIANKYGTIEELTKLEKEKDEEIAKLKEIRNVLKKYKAESILILGTSDGMVEKIAENLKLPKISETIYKKLT